MDDGSKDPGTTGGGEPELAGLHVRLVQVFFSPGALVRALADRPAWGLALLLGAVLTLLQFILIPVEVWEVSTRAAMAARGQEIPQGFESASRMMRMGAIGVAPVAYAVISFVWAGLITLLFAFVLGDEGRYRQYLAVLAHAWLIPAIVGLLLVPLKISQQNPQFTLNLSAFVFFLPEGYLTRVATILDLSTLWALVVSALGAHAIDPRRSVGSATSVLLGVFVCLALLLGLIPGIG